MSSLPNYPTEICEGDDFKGEFPCTQVDPQVNGTTVPATVTAITGGVSVEISSSEYSDGDTITIVCRNGNSYTCTVKAC